MKNSQKIRTIGFGILENHVFNKILNALAENSSLTDVTISVSDCKELSKTIEKFHSSKVSNVKYLWFKIRSKTPVIIPSDGNF